MAAALRCYQGEAVEFGMLSIVGWILAEYFWWSILLLVNNSGFWMSMEWFGRMQYSQVYEDRILVQYFGVVQCALQGRSISLSIAGCIRTAGTVLLDMAGFSI